MSLAFLNGDMELIVHYADTGNIFDDFHHAVKTFVEELLQSPASAIRPYAKDIDALVRLVTTHSPQIAQSVQAAMNNVTRVAKHFADVLLPITKDFQAWVTQNGSVFTSIQNTLSDFQTKYNISKDQAVQVMRSYKWFITPSLPISLIYAVIEVDRRTDARKKRSAVNAIFVTHFESNNWKNLEDMVDVWHHNPLFKKRYRILRNIVKTIKQGDVLGVNVTEVVLPALVAQIDGCLTDYMDSKGLQYPANSTKKKMAAFKTGAQRMLSPDLHDLTNEFVLDILFQHAVKGQELAIPFKFNRHKIQHGEYTNYGRKECGISHALLITHYSELKSPKLEG
jgi:hypothetical protein